MGSIFVFASGSRPAWLMLLALLGFALSSWATPFQGYGWHDQQRVAQLLLLLLACGFVLFARAFVVGRFVWPVLAILALGGVSTLHAELPVWAVREWALQAGLVILALVLAQLLKSESAQWAVACIAVVVGGGLALQFFVGYAAAFISGIRMLDAFTLFSGFSNPRFFGQFQIFLMPLLVALVLHCQVKHPGLAGLVMVVLVGQWCIAYALGGRGLILGLLVAHASLLFLRFAFFRFISVQLIAALIGLLLFWLLFCLVPIWLGWELTLRDTLRPGLSAREVLWLEALELITRQPWLGVGPMHFSASINPVAAHPHQMLLQWASEWGMPAALGVMMLAAWGMLSAARCLRRDCVAGMDAALWVGLVGGLILAQVDGVFVMPYTQIWMTVFVGMALARWSLCQPSSGMRRHLIMLTGLLVAVVLGYVVIAEAPHLPEIQQRFIELHAIGNRPRFWSQGWIVAP
jgi:hypothetical protein